MAINCTKIALKSQLVYTGDFEVAASARQKLHFKIKIVREKSPVLSGLYCRSVTRKEINRFSFVFVLLLCDSKMLMRLSGEEIS